MKNQDWKAILRFIGIMLMAEGGLMALCLVPALHFGEYRPWTIGLCAAFTLAVGAMLWVSFGHYRQIKDRRMSYLLVTLLWVTLAVFGTLPFLATGTTSCFTRAWFEAMSGITSTGATVYADVAALPASVLLWRSMSQWFGGFGIVLLVLALSPRLGINNYSLYTAEASSADNTGKTTVKTTETVQHTLLIYLILTIVFILLLLLSGMELWDAVNLTFTNISSGGFSVNSDSIASITHTQQYILAAAMLLSGVNFTLLYLLFTLRWKRIGNRLDQFRSYIIIAITAVVFVSAGLHFKNSYAWGDAFRIGTVQTISALTTTGSVAADTTSWWTPIGFILLMLSICGSMAGSTSGGLKIMRMLILMRNARGILRNRLHPNAVNPVRLNGKPVSDHIINNVMIIFMVYGITMMLGVMGLLLCGTTPNEAIGASVGCLTGYGPGLGATGGFGSYAGFSHGAMWICSVLMLFGRLECMTVLILLLPRFWRRH